MTIGIDITKNKRFKKEKTIKKFLSKSELEIYFNIKNKVKKREFLAGRFSSKEALYKADNSFSKFKDISILNDDSGKPIVKVNDSVRGEIKLSISHEKKYTVSVIIIDKKNYN